MLWAAVCKIWDLRLDAWGGLDMDSYLGLPGEKTEPSQGLLHDLPDSQVEFRRVVDNLTLLAFRKLFGRH